MGKLYSHINEDLATWIRSQHLFFVATAPSIPRSSTGESGRGDVGGFVNCSPKGLGAFAIVDASTVAYLDLTGSGVETIAHLRDNGRIVILFCALEGAPKIVRLHGRGTPLMPEDAEFARLRPLFGEFPGVRSIIKIDVTRVSDSCGFGVPQYKYVGERDALLRWAEKKGEKGIADYQRTRNAASIDGLPGYREPVAAQAEASSAA